jgi:membrane fusion protein, multidrug efflux system
VVLASWTLLSIYSAVAALSATAPTSDLLADKDGRIRTQFVPRNEVVLSSELSAKIASLPFREGDAFHAGQALVTFDCALFQAQLNKALATLEAARATLKVSQRMAELNSIGALEVAQADARVKESVAEVAYMQATVGKCVIVAPYAGHIVKRAVAQYQYVSPGTPLLGIIDSTTLELQMIVPSHWLARLKPGTAFSVQVDELGQTVVAAHVIRVGARIDPVTQTATVVGTVDAAADNGPILSGMSGWATFTPR